MKYACPQQQQLLLSETASELVLFEDLRPQHLLVSGKESSFSASNA
jgi:hypothetical protein